MAATVLLRWILSDAAESDQMAAVHWQSSGETTATGSPKNMPLRPATCTDQGLAQHLRRMKREDGDKTAE